MIAHARLVLIAGAALCAAAGAVAQEGGSSFPEDPYRPLNEEELLELFTDATVRGCYNTRIEAFNERTASNGRFYDNLQGGLDVGYWWVDGIAICYYYEVYNEFAGPGPHCFNVVPRGRYYDFMSADGGGQVASTQCEDEPTV